MKKSLDVLKKMFGISSNQRKDEFTIHNKPTQPFYIPVKEKPKSEKKDEPVEYVDYHNEFLRTFRKLTYKHRAWDVWTDFIIMTACAFSNAVDKSHFSEREYLYLRAAKKYDEQEWHMFPELLSHITLALEQNPEQDFLGSIFMELNLGSSERGQFFTPYCVCDTMAKICENDICDAIVENGYVTINDCCCGAGATLIAGINEAKRKFEEIGLNYQNHVLVVAQDIDEIAALMCYIQLSLLGVAGFVKIGNSLTEPIIDDDSSDYWYTPMYFSEIWYTRRWVKEFDRIMRGDE